MTLNVKVVDFKLLSQYFPWDIIIIMVVMVIITSILGPFYSFNLKFPTKKKFSQRKNI